MFRVRLVCRLLIVHGVGERRSGDPRVLAPGMVQALSPHYLFTYLERNGKVGWESLAGALLAFTGVPHCLPSISVP